MTDQFLSAFVATWLVAGLILWISFQIDLRLRQAKYKAIGATTKMPLQFVALFIFPLWPLVALKLTAATLRPHAGKKS